MKIVYIILGLLLLAFVIYMLSGKSRTTLPSISITASGNLPRGPIRTNISDESFTQLHAKLKTGLTTQQVRQEDGHVAFEYGEGVTVLLNGKPATILGFKDKHTYGGNDKEYGHIISHDGSDTLSFESLAPSIPTDSNNRELVTKYRFRGPQGTGTAMVQYRSVPNQDGTTKQIHLTGNVVLA